MPACPRTAAWSLVPYLYRWRWLLKSSGPAASLTHRSSAAQKDGALRREKTASATRRTSHGSLSTFDFTRDTQLSRNTMSTAMTQRMVWVDLEMTGLDIDRDQIIEMACIITDSELNVLAEGPNLIIKQPDELLEGMSEWCKAHHGKSGLTQAVRDSKITLEQAEYEFLSFVRQHTPPGQCPLAGNSVHADKRFLEKYMPQFMYHLHYRIIDVSTIKELCRRWFPEEYKMVPHKKATHRALSDIHESIKELQFYRVNVFRLPAEDQNKEVESGGGSNSRHT